jgi:hypothetical protein
MAGDSLTFITGAIFNDAGSVIDAGQVCAFHVEKSPSILTSAPTKQPSKAPSTKIPTQRPTKAPTKQPSKAPSTKMPTQRPTKAPTKVPSNVPVKGVTNSPSKAPTQQPTNVIPPTNCGLFKLNIFCPRRGKCGFLRRLLNLNGCE